MLTFLRRPVVGRVLRAVIPLLGGAVFATLWVVAEWARPQDGGALVAVFFGAAIALSAWMPWAALGLIVVVPALQGFGLLPPPEPTTWPQYLAIGIVAGVVGARSPWLLRAAAVVVGAVGSVAAGWALTVPSVGRSDVWGVWLGEHEGARTDLSAIAFALVGVTGIGWAIGVAVGSAWRLNIARGRILAAKQQTDEAVAELQVVLDRAAIARDVHDSLAHSLAIVVSQAQGASALVGGDGVAAQALTDIATVSREALTDVRALVERIEDETPGVHRVGDIAGLLRQMREVGMTVTFEEHGDPGVLGRQTEAAAYRIVQESCTNALKHAGRHADVRVVLDQRGAGLGVIVESRGSAPLVAAAGPGVGIRGMRERARLVGGWLRAERDLDADTHAWVVTAWLPGAAA
ncbi:histidine kinase [Curtobacterium sp. MCBD17_040]|uniref:sensor histidine kinase n=1 Tax=Curtobacterium sp. MCBD17_040 TaxID=2175674 RepID=UPI000DA91066|nr:histidine kinase [Curtobacterium sp. MCBD17_040]WIB65801.1 histidine kinase [Curtobacterium sp. MCBD17_040]